MGIERVVHLLNRIQLGGKNIMNFKNKWVELENVILVSGDPVL